MQGLLKEGLVKLMVTIKTSKKIENKKATPPKPSK